MDYKRKQQREIRHERKYQERGSPNPVCPGCGCINIVALTGAPFSRLPVSLQKKLIEEHHLAGRVAGEWQVHACLNCHAVFSDNQYDWDVRLRRPETWIEQLAAFLQGLADWFRQLGTTLTELADMLQAWVEQLLGLNQIGEAQS